MNNLVYYDRTRRRFLNSNYDYISLSYVLVNVIRNNPRKFVRNHNKDIGEENARYMKPLLEL